MHLWRRLPLVAALLLGSVGTSQRPPSREQLEEQILGFEAILEARQTELEELEAALSEINTQLDAQLTERDRLADQIVRLSEEQETLRAQTRTLRAQQRAAEARISGLETQSRALKTQLQDLILSLHKRQGGSNVGALSQSESLFDLRVKNYYLSRLTEQDVTLLTTFDRTTAELSRARRERSARVRTLSARVRELEANRATLATTQTELEAVIAALSETRAGQLAQREALLQEQSSIETDLTGARTQLAAELERRREEAARLAAEAAERAAAANTPEDEAFSAEAERLRDIIESLNDPDPVAEQAYALPFANPVVVRPFGEDGATDILLRAAQPGSAVRAVKSGVVMRASLITANSGYTVALQHGSDLISAYTNLQAPVVEIGQRVEQGDILGYLGGGIVNPDILQFRLGRVENFDIIYQDPVPLLGIGAG